MSYIYLSVTFTDVKYDYFFLSFDRDFLSCDTDLLSCDTDFLSLESDLLTILFFASRFSLSSLCKVLTITAF